jgi:hypothetical protein
MEGIASAAAQTPLNQKTQSMAVTLSPSKVEVVCPICRKGVTTYRGQGREPLPLMTEGIADWDEIWPRPRGRNVIDKARKHFKQHVKKGITMPCSIAYKHTAQNIPKLPGQKINWSLYKSRERSQWKASRQAAK